MSEKPRSPTLEEVIKKLQELKLTHWAKAVAADLASTPNDITQELCQKIILWSDKELAERGAVTIASRIKGAKFIRVQTIEAFKFDYNASTRKVKTPYLTLYNQTIKGELPRAAFIGHAGLGKTHLARALGHAACHARNSVLFTTAAKMTNLLASAKAMHNLEAELNKYRRPKVLIIDELGYVSMDSEASNLFYQVISARHDQGLGTIVTSNIPFGEWNQIFANNPIAHAMIDRITEKASIFYLEGISYRETQGKTKN